MKFIYKNLLSLFYQLQKLTIAIIAIFLCILRKTRQIHAAIAIPIGAGQTHAVIASDRRETWQSRVVKTFIPNFFRFLLNIPGLPPGVAKAMPGRRLPCPAKSSKQDRNDGKIVFSFFLLYMFSLSAVPVRVLLEEHKKPEWKLQSNEGFSFKDPTTGTRVCFGASYFTLSITYQKGHFYINGKKVKRKSLYIIPNRKYVEFDGGKFDGCMLLQKDRKRCYLMNLVDSEEYLFSVLKTESWPTWPLEMNKVQAIASRSYLFHQLLNSRKTDVPYHIKNTNHHQTYSGVHDKENMRKAVKATEGIILSFKREPILAMFDCCCGSVVPAKSLGLADYSKAPYLARPYACTYCKKSKIYSWKAEYSFSEFRDLLQEGHDTILHDLTDIKIGAKDKAGVVKHIVAKTKKDEIHFTSKDMYKLFKEVKSFSFTVKKRSQKVTLQGKGYGHHLGLCQWGAREMIAQGWDYEKVLEFYYPGTTFMKLKG